MSSSGGNAGIAAAYAASQLGIKARVIVPSSTAETSKRKIAGYGADVQVHGSVWDEADKYARSLCESEGSIILHHIKLMAHVWMKTRHTCILSTNQRAGRATARSLTSFFNNSTYVSLFLVTLSLSFPHIHASPRCLLRSSRCLLVAEDCSWASLRASSA